MPRVKELGGGVTQFVRRFGEFALRVGLPFLVLSQAVGQLLLALAEFRAGVVEFSLIGRIIPFKVVELSFRVVEFLLRVGQFLFAGLELLFLRVKLRGGVVQLP